MRITRLPKIRGHRVFRDFAWPSDLHAFGQFNLIYGWNGVGKTTLSSLFGHLERRVNISEGDVTFEFDEVAIITGSQIASANLPTLRVFNSDFIYQNILQSGSTLSPIYILGKESADKQLAVDKLKADLVAAREDHVGREAAQKDAAKTLDTFRIDSGKRIKSALMGGGTHRYNNYDKATFSADVATLTTEMATSHRVSADSEQRLRQQKDAKARDQLGLLTGSAASLGILVDRVRKSLSRTVSSQAIETLAKDPKLNAWVQHGLDLHAARDSCAFCSGTLSAARNAALEQHFNDAVRSLQNDLDALTVEIECVRDDTARLAPPDLHALYEELELEYRLALSLFDQHKPGAVKHLNELGSTVHARRADVFAVREADASVGHAAMTANEQLANAVRTLNDIIRKHNERTSKFGDSIVQARDRLAWSMIADGFDEHGRLAKAQRDAAAEVDGAARSVVDLESQIAALEREMREHRTAADELNAELRSYLGRSELEFVVEDNGYALRRGGRVATHLSEGEKTAIAFLYFLKSLQDKAFGANGVVVIDDPVSSLDANALFSAFGYMKERTKHFEQLFVLTHSFPFFRQVKNWFHHLPKQKSSKPERRLGRFYLLQTGTDNDGVRTSRLGPLDPLLEEHESEYHYLFKRVHEEAHRSAGGTLERYYGMPNVARRFVETFLAFRFPDAAGDLSPRMDRVQFDGAKKTRILRLLNTYSHAPAVGEPEHDLSLLAETQAVLVDVLEMIKAADPTHYAGLEALVAAKEVP